jgi:Ca2+-binding RTX toxin-like protein
MSACPLFGCPERGERALLKVADSTARHPRRRGRDLVIGGPDRDRLLGGHGRDSLHGDAPPGERVDVSTTGRDRVRGGRGGDLITTGPRADKVWPGLGRDRVRTGRGPDVLFVRADGKPDTYRCGRGIDRLIWSGEREQIDTVVSCEIIHIAGP